IPTLNNKERLQKCLEGLFKQSVAQSIIEIIVVDNGSTDDTIAYLESLSIRLLHEPSKSPYKARNKGIQAASYPIIALLDSNCIPVPEWIDAGIKSLEKGDAAIVCGPITFTYSNPPTITEIADDMVFVSNKVSVVEGSSIPTGQFFTTKEVFDKVGLFMNDIRSGGDIEWSERATGMGFTLGYALEAEVFYPAKQYDAFIRKAKRIGKGRVVMRDLKGRAKGLPWWGYSLWISRPPSPVSLYRRMKEKGVQFGLIRFIGVWWMTWVYRLVRGWWMLVG
ncbi:MAG: glycosyltransferase, partial [Bacteroidota bacterium]